MEQNRFFSSSVSEPVVTLFGRNRRFFFCIYLGSREFRAWCFAIFWGGRETELGKDG